MVNKKSCIIVGGGLAGIAAAVRLAEQGTPVTLVETRQRLGGRATSFIDPTTGETLDNCQHVLMRCCTSLIDLYQRLGVTDAIQWHDTFYFVGPTGRADIMRADPLPAPMHMGRSMLGFKQFTFREKLAIARGMWGIIRCDRSKCADISFAHWLKQHHQPARVVDHFWAVILISACNEQLDQISARYALQVFQDGFLCHRTAHEMGLAAVPLVQLYDAAETVIEHAGGKVLLSKSAETLEYKANRVVALYLGDGTRLEADTFISAVPFDRLEKLSTDAMRQDDPRLSHLHEITASPIIGIHLYFDRDDVMTLPHMALTHSPLHWVFNKGHDTKGQHLHGIISGAHDLVNHSAQALANMAVAEISKVIPNARDAKLVHHRVVKEKRATFAVTPGIDALRPTTQGHIQNLLLAGDWTDTGWPATMEGAVRSGYRAAEIASDQNMSIAELPKSWLYRLLAKQPKEQS